MKDITSRVNGIIVDWLCIDERDVIPEANFADNFGADSLDIVELIVEFEIEFNIVIPDNQVERINTVGEAIACIEKNTSVYAY